MLRRSAARICLRVGIDDCEPAAIDALATSIASFVESHGAAAKKLAESCGRAQATAEDLLSVMERRGMDLTSFQRWPLAVVPVEDTSLEEEPQLVEVQKAEEERTPQLPARPRERFSLADLSSDCLKWPGELGWPSVSSEAMPPERPKRSRSGTLLSKGTDKKIWQEAAESLRKLMSDEPEGAEEVPWSDKFAVIAELHIPEVEGEPPGTTAEEAESYELKLPEQSWDKKVEVSSSSSAILKERKLHLKFKEIPELMFRKLCRDRLRSSEPGLSP